jgi:hypothetical protein
MTMERAERVQSGIRSGAATPATERRSRRKTIAPPLEAVARKAATGAVAPS